MNQLFGQLLDLHFWSKSHRRDKEQRYIFHLSVISRPVTQIFSSWITPGYLSLLSAPPPAPRNHKNDDYRGSSHRDSTAETVSVRTHLHNNSSSFKKKKNVTQVNTRGVANCEGQKCSRKEERSTPKLFLELSGLSHPSPLLRWINTSVYKNQIKLNWDVILSCYVPCHLIITSYLEAVYFKSVKVVAVLPGTPN